MHHPQKMASMFGVGERLSTGTLVATNPSLSLHDYSQLSPPFAGAQGELLQVRFCALTL